ncbi:tenascin-like isoform X1 [Salvelinus alpinus]|uniref:tenascin-like isoform X1 n=1 Tax=Salvelinus alpinus TaxID=8036 RepID=UPI0039FC7EE8
MPLFPSFLLLLLACPALLTPSGSQSLQTGGQRAPRNTKPEGGGQPIKVVISEACVQGDSSQNQGKELDLEPGSSLVLTHRIRLVPGSCGGGCEAEFAALRDRLERLEKEVSALREKCGGLEGGCCTSQQSKGAECSMQPEGDECPNECSDQGRCEDGKCVCFPGFSGPDCSLSDCPGNCNDMGKCVNGQCVCDPGFTGPDCSSESCPGNCNNKGQCVNGKCVCNTGLTGPDCSTKACSGNCNNKGRCENGQCVCNTGLTGPDCSTKACPGNCNNKGRCENGQCVCNTGLTGPDCSTKACPGNCNNKGRCENGQCVCNTGLTGPDCSTKACPGNCNNKGQCVNGKCVCNTGFTGPDCSTKACLGNCKNRGKCVNGKCVCDSGFTGPDCSTKSCPGNCSNRGKCVNGQCVCDMGFTGPDCSAKACPNNCSNKGRCVNGKCVCEVGFTGQDCAAKGCPDNCSNKGRCVKGRCVCRRGFTAPDCSQCEAGFTGVDCGTVMSGVSQLNTKDVTESSVTLFWTPPPVQYDTYHVTFASQKEGDQQITSQVGGKLTAYTQTGLAAGQAYTVTITGEIDGRMGAESTAEFTTLISGPTNLQVVKTTTTSAVVQWEQSQGDIDRYRLTVTPNQTDGTARGRQDLTLPPERDSAQIDGLDPGHLYDITLVAEKGGIKSKPATVQVTPGKSTKTISRVTMPVAPGVESHEGDSAGNTKPVKDIFYTKAKGEEPERVKDWSGPGSVTVEGTNGTKEDTSVRTSTRPLVNTNYRVIPKTGDRITFPRKPYIGGSIHFNGTRVGQGGRRVGHSLLKKPTSRNPLEGPKVKKTLDTDSKPENPFVGDKTIALTVKETNLETSPLGEKDETLTKTYPVGILPVNATPSSGSEQTVSPGLKDLPDRKKDTEIETNEPGPGTEGLEHTTTSEKNTTVHPNGKKCVNKVKLTHRKVNVTRRERVIGGRVNGTIVKSKPTAEQGLAEKEDSALKVSETGHSKTTFHERNLVIHTQSKADDISPHTTQSPTYPTSSSPVSPTSYMSLSSSAPAKHDESMTGMGQPMTDRDVVNAKTLPVPQSQSSNLPPERGPTSSSESEQNGKGPSPSNPEDSYSGKDHVAVAEEGVSKDGEKTADVGLFGTKQNRTKTLRVGGSPPFRRLPPKGPYQRRPNLNMRPFQNRTRSPFSAPTKQNESKTGTGQPMTDRQLVFPKTVTVSPAQSSTLPPDAQPERAPKSSSESEHSGKGYSSSSSTSEESDFTKENVAVAEDGISRDGDRATDVVSSGTERNRSKTLTLGNTPPLRRLPPKGTQQRRPHPNMGAFPNRTRTHLIPPHHPSRGPIRRPFPPKLTNRDNGIIIQTSQPGEQGTYSTSQNDTNTDLKPKTLLRKINATAGKIARDQTYIRNNSSLGQRGQDFKTGHSDQGSQVSKNADSRDSPNQINGSDVTTTGKTGQPLNSVGVQSITSGGFILVWEAPEGMYRNFIVTREEHGSKNEAEKEEEKEEEEEESESEEDRQEEGEAEGQTEKENKGNEEESEMGVSQGKEGVEENTVINSKSDNQRQSSDRNATAKVGDGGTIKFFKVLPGSARSFPFQNLHPQTRYSLSVFGKGPGLHSKIHRLIVSTGPEPPSGLLFSEVTETSFSVSWTKPKSPVSGFKVTYTHTQEGEPISVMVDSGDSTLALSKLSPGSSYEVSVISVLGLDESDAIKDLVMTLPDPPTDLQAINVTDTKALLLWRPALATVDRYVIVYGSEKGSDDVKITVSGNAAEQQLKDLQGSTMYTVTVTSQLGNLDGAPAITVFTTTSGSGGDGEGPRDLKASQVTPRSALLTWKPPSAAVGSYKLTYQTEGQEMQEVTIDATVTEFKLTRLHPMSKYTVQLQGERGGSYTAAISTEFTTGNLRYPFPSDCSQELLNGMHESGEVEIFPKGRQGKPVLVYCDQVTDGGGWTVFQRRMDGKTDFFRDWKNYSKGFGELSGEFWLGNENLHNLTSMAPMTLRVDLRAGDESVFAKYSTFTVDTVRRNYALKVSGYSGTAGDSMSYHNGRMFSTRDRDPAPFITRCAMSYRGGWWYKNCHQANLNGLYDTNVNHQGLIWTAWKGKDYSVPFTEMKLRPTSFTPPTQGY